VRSGAVRRRHADGAHAHRAPRRRGAGRGPRDPHAARKPAAAGRHVRGGRVPGVRGRGRAPPERASRSVSSTTQVAVLAPLGTDAGPSRAMGRSGDRPFVRLSAFAALGLYGVLRWGTLMKPAPTWRLLGLLVVAVALAGIGPALLERERAVAAAGGRGE